MTTLLNQDPPSGTRLNTITAEMMPLPVLPDSEPDFWKRYSSHHEFPLSLAASVVLHVGALLLIVLAGVLMFRWGGPGPVVIGDPITWPDEGDSTWDGSGNKGGRPEGTENLKETITNPGVVRQNEGQEAPFKIDMTELGPQIPKPEDRKAQDVWNIKGERGTDQVPGKVGPGSGGGKGGPGHGPQGGKPTGRVLRTGRWTISIAYNDENQLMNRLAELQVILVVPEGDKFRVWKDLLNRSAKGDLVEKQQIEALNRIWFTMSSLDERNSVGLALNLTNVPRFVALFIPEDLEKALLAKELAHAGLATEAQANEKKLETTFEVHRRGTTWDIRVLRQAPKGK